MMKMTEENIKKIREAANLLSSLSDEDWQKISNLTLQGEIKYVSTESIEKRISYYLREIGIPTNYIGYNYIISAVKLLIEDREEYSRVTKVLYPTIAKKYGTTPSGVERAIRHSIEVAFIRGNSKVIKEIFRNTYSLDKEKTTNSEFLFGLAEYMKLLKNA